MANFTRLTLQITEWWGDSYINLAEIQLLDASGAAIDLTGTTATASSVYNPSWDVYKTIDGGIGHGDSSWSSEHIDTLTLPVTLTYVFPTALPIGVVRLVNAIDGPSGENIKAGTLTAMDTSNVEWVASFTNRESSPSYIDPGTNQEVRVYSEHTLVSTAPPPTGTPPTLSAIPNQTAYLGQSFSLNVTLYASTTEGDAITYTISGALPSGLSLDSASGIVSGTPTQLGTFNLSATATDDDGSSSPQAFSITVTQPSAVSVTLESNLIDVLMQIGMDIKNIQTRLTALEP